MKEFIPAFADVPYVPKPAPAQKLDIYLPGGSGPGAAYESTVRPGAGYPVILYLHGGGFAVGDKESGTEEIGAALLGLDRGYAVVSVNYRLSDTDKAPAQIYDVKAAVRFIRANAVAFGLNQDKIVIMGVSAGASLAALAAASANHPAFEAGLAAMGAAGTTSAVAAPGSAVVPDDVAAAVIYYGLFNLDILQAQYDWLSGAADPLLDARYLPTWATQRRFFMGIDYSGRVENPKGFLYQYLGAPFAQKRDLIAFVNAETYVSAACPPFYIRHGEIDEAVPFLQSVDLAAALKAAGAAVDFKTIPGAEHGMPGQNFFRKYDPADVYEWLDRIR